MLTIQANKLNISYPVMGADQFSLKKQLVSSAVGGRLDLKENNRSYVDAITDASFDIYTGETVAFLGHNGSGKTTLLRVISGILAPSSGNLNVFGEVSCLIDPSAGMDMEATGHENIYLLSYSMGQKRLEISRHIDEITDFAELGTFIDLPVRTYSQGMIARLAFSVATAYEHQIIVMDEGIAAGDAGFMERASRRLKNFLKSAKCVIIATHSKDFADNHCTRSIILEKGRIVSDKQNPNVALD